MLFKLNIIVASRPLELKFCFVGETRDVHRALTPTACLAAVCHVGPERGRRRYCERPPIRRRVAFGVHAAPLCPGPLECNGAGVGTARRSAKPIRTARSSLILEDRADAGALATQATVR